MINAVLIIMSGWFSLKYGQNHYPIGSSSPTMLEHPNLRHRKLEQLCISTYGLRIRHNIHFLNLGSYSFLLSTYYRVLDYFLSSFF